MDTLVIADAVPYPNFVVEATRQPQSLLDNITNKLSVDDYRSIFFLLLNKTHPEDFLHLVKKNGNFLKGKFLECYYTLKCKEAMLIEIFGTMQRYDLLKILGTCQHEYQKDKKTFTQIDALWKVLYTVCEQLTDGDVIYLKDRFFHGCSMPVTSCAEELFCLAYTKRIFHDNDTQRMAEVFKDFQPECYSLLMSAASDTQMKYYPIRRPTRQSPTGLAVIINHENFYPANFPARPESQLDASALKSLWEGYGFKCCIYLNLNDEQVMQLFDALSKMDHSPFEAFVACYLSHGDEGVVYASNCKPVRLMSLVDKMANECTTLVGKPKLFFVQACQGQQIQGVGVSLHSQSPAPRSEEEVFRNEPPNRSTSLDNTAHRSDVLIVNSSIEGYVSFRHSGQNSWFIEALVDAMERHGEEMTVANVMTIVANLVTQQKGTLQTPNAIYMNCKQTPVRHNTLTYELQLKRLRP